MDPEEIWKYQAFNYLDGWGQPHWRSLVSSTELVLIQRAMYGLLVEIETDSVISGIKCTKGMDINTGNL